ncbi:MAG: sugar transferase, partial [Planctomycetota bacterium]
HRTCRLFGPLVLHAGARLAAHAAVIGPAVVGPGAVVQEHAVVCQALVLPRATVKARGHVVRQVVSPQNGSAAPPAGPPSSPLAALAAEPPRPVRPRGWRRLPHSLARGRLYRFTKRAADTLAAFAGLVVLSPLLVFVGLLIKLTSRGPVLFVHEREGLGGRVFRCWKFRTMVAGAHAAQRALYCQNALDGPQFKLAHDPRITRLGSFLRRANIDELPQLINVVLGQMSLIGPRPSPFRENQICVSWREARLSVRPGITGLWQVCRHERQFGDFHQWIYFDLLYVRHRSLPLDVRIFLATLLTLGGRWSVPLHWMIPGSRLHAAQPLPPSAAAAAAQRVECAGAPAPRSGPVPPLC